ncbi:MAG TPA: VOC family protein, partial [Sphingomonas sp.]|nr:VOC family protein [Sphingomonas sp.]
MARINYVELPTGDIGATRGFYEAAFGWRLTGFGPSYAATTSGDVDLGLQGDAAEATAAPLAVIAVRGWTPGRRGSRRRAAPSPGRSSPFPAAGASTSAILPATSWRWWRPIIEDRL